MIGTIKAIETQYKGYRFRSRLEARWAVFFDALGVKWEYESEGLNIDGEWYLPDFRLFEPFPCLIEIKPQDKKIVANRPHVYLAGKMSSGYDYREMFSRVGRSFSVTDFEDGFPETEHEIGDCSIIYVGPYATSCDHGCAHGKQHTAANCGLNGMEEGRKLVESCRKAIDICGIFFAHFETANQFGTLVELGWAYSYRSSIWMTMTSSLHSALANDPREWEAFGGHDLWFAEACSQRFAISDEPMDTLAAWLAEEYPVPRERKLIRTLKEHGHDAFVFYGLPDEVSIFPHLPQWFADLSKSRLFRHAMDAAKSARFEHGETPRV
jgi:hypothetical protein